MNASGFEAIDYVIFGVYIVLLIALGLLLSRNKSGEEKNANDYFLAGNTLTWWAVGASLIAANISAEQFIGMSGSGYKIGICIAAYEIMAAVALIVIGKFLLPIMIERKIFTIPQFLRERYNDGVGLAFTILWLLLYVFVNLTSVAWLGALAIEQILGLQGMAVDVMGLTISVRMLLILGLFIVAGAYSIYGGLASVAWTDVMQVVFLVGGGLITAYFALVAVSGEAGSALEGLAQVYNFIKSDPTDTHFNLVVRQSLSPDAYADLPGIAAIVGGVWLTNLGYWGFNQYIIQKGLAAKSIDEAKKGMIFAGFLKILIPFVVVLPGICAYVLFNSPDHADILGSLSGTIERSDDAYPWLIRNFTPVGIKGLSFAALTAAIISSLASMFNSTATLFTMDIYKKYLRKNASDKNLVNVGRLTAVVSLVLALIAVEPLLGGLDQAFQYIQEYSGFIYPGIIVVFGLGLLWKRASAAAAVWTAILTIPMGVLFKLWLPEVAFQFRAGYIFIILLFFFVFLSYRDRKSEKAELPSATDRCTMMKWAKILGGSGLAMIAAAAVVSIGGAMAPANAAFAYLNDIGFQAFYFFGVLVGCSAIWLYSDSNDTVKDVKALPVNLALFRTTRGYTYGTIGILVIVAALYIALW